MMCGGFTRQSTLPGKGSNVWVRVSTAYCSEGDDVKRDVTLCCFNCFIPLYMVNSGCLKMFSINSFYYYLLRRLKGRLVNVPSTVTHITVGSVIVFESVFGSLAVILLVGLLEHSPTQFNTPVLGLVQVLMCWFSVCTLLFCLCFRIWSVYGP